MASKIIIYTDGGCEPNPGTGGWAAILQYYKKENVISEKVITGGEENTTNNRMEMMAVLKGLQILKWSCHITVYSDSKYVINGLGSWVDGNPHPDRKGWVVGWQKRRWRKKDKGIVQNRDLWESLYNEVMRHNCVKMRFVRGHAGNEYNERCDELAVKARLNLRSP